MPRNIKKLIADAIAIEDSLPVIVDEIAMTFQAIIEGTGAVTATILIEGSNDSQAVAANIRWTNLGTISLSGTNEDSDGFGTAMPWLQVRASLTVITGTGATVNVILVS